MLRHNPQPMRPMYSRNVSPGLPRWVIGAAMALILLCAGAAAIGLLAGGWAFLQPLLQQKYTFYRVYKDGKWGYINQKGDLAIALQFDEAQDFQEGLAAVKVRDRWGYINALEKFVRNPDLRDAGAFSEGLAAVRLDNKWGYIGKDGKIAISPRYDCASAFSEGFAAVRKGNKWGYVDS